MSIIFGLRWGGDINGEVAGDESGVSVSLSADGSFVAIGANLNDGNGTNSGHVSIFQINNEISINENISEVKTFSANKPVTWSLIGGEDKDLFSINSNTGELSFNGENIQQLLVNEGHAEIYKKYSKPCKWAI